ISSLCFYVCEYSCNLTKRSLRNHRLCCKNELLWNIKVHYELERSILLMLHISTVSHLLRNVYLSVQQMFMLLIRGMIEFKSLTAMANVLLTGVLKAERGNLLIHWVSL